MTSLTERVSLLAEQAALVLLCVTGIRDPEPMDTDHAPSRPKLEETVMRARLIPAIGTLVVGAWLVAVPAASPAFAAPCDAYSGACPSTPAGDGGGGGGGGAPAGGGGSVPAGGANDASSGRGELPFTGGELVLMTLVGAGAVAGGTALVVAGRRRRGAEPGTP